MCAGALVAGLVVSRPAVVVVYYRTRLRRVREGIDSRDEAAGFPTQREAAQITGVVFAFVLLMAMFLWGTDKILEFTLYDVILGWK